MNPRWLFTAVALLVAPAVHAAPPQAIAVDTQALAAHLRGLVLASLPDPILTTERNWGNQKEVLIGMKWHREGRIRFRAEPMKALRNDGLWQRVRIVAVDPQKTLGLAVKDVVQQPSGAVTFDAYLGLDVKVLYDQEIWKSGTRLYGGDMRARTHAALKLTCEVTNRVEVKPGALLPDVVMRVRVTNAELHYTEVVCEHILGIDGRPAEKIGEIAQRIVREFKPSIETDLREKANVAIVKAADTKEVRVELDRLVKGK